MAPLVANIDKFYPGLIASTVLLLLVTRFFRNYLLRDRCRLLRLPPGPKGWPVVGALPLLGAKPHEAMAKLAKQYGPVMYLKMGATNIVVASTAGAARAFLKTLDANFMNRPDLTAPRIACTQGEGIVFGYHGPKWKLLRKLNNLHIAGPKAREEWTEVREQEVTYMLRAMCDASSRGVHVVMPMLLLCALANNVGQMAFGKRLLKPEDDESLAETNEFKDVIVEHLKLAGLFNIGDFIPSIAWMDLQGIEGRIQKTHKKLDTILNEIIEQHVKTTHERVGNPDFLDHLLVAASSDAPGDERLGLASIKGLLLDFFLAGTDTVAGAVEWGLAELIKNPSIFKRAHEEMDQVIGRDRRLRESDLPNLPYLRAMCKEVLRKHPSLALIPRVATEDCQVEGYDIPRGTWLNVNVWAIGRDPETWENPLDFVPERFLSTGKGAGINHTGNDFELIPFGAGRRICAGMRLGMVLLEYILGTLVHAFEWRLPDGVDEVNMEETFGLTIQKTVPLSAIVSQRLSPSAYAS